MDQLDNVLDGIQKQCDDVVTDMFGETNKVRWDNPSFAGEIENPDGVGEVTGDCRDMIRIYLKIKNDTITKALFYTTGCGASIVSADVCCELATGKNIDDASEISGEDIIKVLGRIPSDKTHCAHLASSSLQEAIGSWLEKKRKEKDLH